MDKPYKTIRLGTGTRTYYFDAFRDRRGHPYMVLTEKPEGAQKGKRGRQRIYVHLEDIEAFSKAVKEMSDFVASNIFKR